MKEGKKLKAVVVAAWYAPYRLPLLRELARREDVDLTVVFCSDVEGGREWSAPSDLPFKAIFLRSVPLLTYRRRKLYGETNAFRWPLGLFRTLRRLKPDVVAAYEFRIECMLAAWGSLLSGCSYVTWSDVTADHDARMGRLRMVIRRLLLWRSRALIGSSTETLEHFRRSFAFPENRSFLSILSAHVDDIQKAVGAAPSPRPPEEGGVRFVFAGRIVGCKGLDALLAAFADHRRRYPASRLTLVGEGPLRAELEGLAASLGCAESVVFRGSVPYADMPAEMRRHDVFVFPTRFDVFGLVVAEAVACGLPVICSRRAGAARDLVRDNGVIVDPVASSLVSAMDLLAGSAELRRSMADAGRRVLAEHNLSAAVDGFVQALKTACR